MKRPGILILFTFLAAVLSYPQSKPRATDFTTLSLADTVTYLAAGMQSSTLQSLVSQRGTQFVLTDSVREGLKACGAADNLLQLMKPKSGAAQQEWAPAYAEICTTSFAADAERAERALASLPDHPTRAAFDFLTARLLRDDENSAAALKLAQEAASLEPDILENQTFLALTLNEAGQSQQALSLINSVLAKAPDLGDAHRVIGRILEAKGDAKGAIREYKEAVRLAPESSRSNLNLASILEDNNDVAGAEQAYRVAVQAIPKSFWAHYDFAIFLREKKHDPEASIREYREALAINPTEPRGLTNLGAALCDEGEHEEAVKVYGKLFSTYPQWTVGRECYAKSLYYQGNFVEAVKQAQEGSRTDPENMVFERYLGLSYLRLGNLEEGLALIMKVLKNKPEKAYAHLDAAVALRLNHREDEALNEYREAARLDPTDASPIMGIGGLLQAKGKREEALKEYEKAIPLMNSDKYRQWVNDMRAKLEEEKVATAPPDASAVPAHHSTYVAGASAVDDFLHQHATGDAQQLVDMVLSADLNELQAWKRDPRLIGKPYTVLCTQMDTSVAADLIRGAWTRYQDRATAAGETEMTWAMLLLMMSRRTDRANLQALIDRVEQLMKSDPLPVQGVTYSLSEGALGMQKHVLDTPPNAKPPLPNSWAACHLLEHTRPIFNRGQELELQSPRMQVLATIARDGSVTKTKVITKASDTLSKIASDTVMQYKYEPIFIGGKALEVDTMVEVDFKCPAGSEKDSTCP